MRPPPDPVLCHRCRRPVEITRDQYEVFEHMHYVCFHYEYEHDPADPDEECSAGGCPSAAINPRPDRRPGPEPPRSDHPLAGGWIVAANLRRFLELAASYVSYQLDDLDWQAVEAGTETLATEAQSFTYPIVGRQGLNVTLRRNTGGDKMSVKITSRPDRLLAARITGLMDAFS